jgi:small subunit ribosomal protein S20
MPRLKRTGISDMPRTKSAAKQARASVRRQSHNRAIKSRLHTLENKLLTLLDEKKTTDAAAAYQALSSALDKAAKVQVIHRNTASRKKSRLAARLKKATATA